MTTLEKLLGNGRGPVGTPIQTLADGSVQYSDGNGGIVTVAPGEQQAAMYGSIGYEDPKGLTASDGYLRGWRNVTRGGENDSDYIEQPFTGDAARFSQYFTKNGTEYYRPGSDFHDWLLSNESAPSVSPWDVGRLQAAGAYQDPEYGYAIPKSIADPINIESAVHFGQRNRGFLDKILTMSPLILGAIGTGAGIAGGFGGAAGASAEASGAAGEGVLAGSAAGDTLAGAGTTLADVNAAIGGTGAAAEGSGMTLAELQNVIGPQFAQNIPGISTAAGASILPGVTQGSLSAAASSFGFADIASALAKVPVTTLLSAAANLGAAALGSNAAGRAAQAGVDASTAAIGEQRRQFDLTRADNAPFLATGTAANQRLRQLLGLDTGYTGADSGSLTRKFTTADRDADPVYQSGLQFGLDEGTKAINARAIASGGYDSGATLKALTRFGNDYASTKAGDAYNRYTNDQGSIYNRLAGVSGSGQTAANTVANAGQASTNAISNLTTDAGNARAAGIVGGANAWGGAAQGINSALNAYSSNQILEALLRRQPTSVYG